MPIVKSLTPTLLGLARYAEIMGINPVHFQGAAGSTTFPVQGTCGHVWPRYSWQASDMISHEDLSRALYDAEQEIAAVLGYFAAPRWIEQEVHRYPRPQRRDAWRTTMQNVRGQTISVRTHMGKVIDGGQRATGLVGQATVAGGTLTYSDEDSDGFYETATIVLATSLLEDDVCQAKLYHADYEAAPAWEIRPVRSKTIDETAEQITIVADAWLFIDPELQGAYPTTEGFQTINLDTTANYVTAVDVYWEYNNYAVPHARFFWEGAGCGSCEACIYDVATGCINVRDADGGFVTAYPAAYDTTEAVWAPSCVACRDPDVVKLYYYSGNMSSAFLNHSRCDPLDPYLATAIAYLATARLERPICGCSNVLSLSQELQSDMRDMSGRRYTPPELLLCPFGTRTGEIKAFQRISLLDSTAMGVAV